VLLELERLYNHVGDVGMILNDTGFAVATPLLPHPRAAAAPDKRVTGNRLPERRVIVGGVGRERAGRPWTWRPRWTRARDFDEMGRDQPR